MNEKTEDFFKCGLSIMRGNKAMLVKKWLPFVTKNIEELFFSEHMLDQVITLAYDLMQKKQFDFSKMAGISMWVSLHKVPYYPFLLTF